MKKIFISYHHLLDQQYKDELIRQNEIFDVFEDYSVDTHEISDELPTQTIRQIIRDNYLRDSTVTILLVGAETHHRKHVDWELKSSMIEGSINKKSGLLIATLPSSNINSWHTTEPHERSLVYPEYSNWYNVETKSEYRESYPSMPERIIDNLVADSVKLSIVPWSKIDHQPDNLRLLLDIADKNRITNIYDTSRKMRMNNYNPNAVSAVIGLRN